MLKSLQFTLLLMAAFLFTLSIVGFLTLSVQSLGIFYWNEGYVIIHGLLKPFEGIADGLAQGLSMPAIASFKTDANLIVFVMGMVFSMLLFELLVRKLDVGLTKLSQQAARRGRAIMFRVKTKWGYMVGPVFENAETSSLHESAALLALDIHGGPYDGTIKHEIEELMNQCPGGEIMFTDRRQMLIKLPGTWAAVEFVQGLANVFKQYAGHGLDASSDPVFRGVLHSLSQDKDLFRDDVFIWQMLKTCVGPNQILCSEAAKTQYDQQLLEHDPDKATYSIRPFGVYSQLGEYHNCQVFRLVREKTSSHS